MRFFNTLLTHFTGFHKSFHVRKTYTTHILSLVKFSDSVRRLVCDLLLTRMRWPYQNILIRMSVRWQFWGRWEDKAAELHSGRVYVMDCLFFIMRQVLLNFESLKSQQVRCFWSLCHYLTPTRIAATRRLAPTAVKWECTLHTLENIFHIKIPTRLCYFLHSWHLRVGFRVSRSLLSNKFNNV